MWRAASRASLIPIVIVLCLAALLFGCRQPGRISQADAHAITREMVAAVRTATGGRAEINVRPERPPRNASAEPTAQELPDQIFITLPMERNGQPDLALRAAIEKSLDRIAHAHKLDRIQRSASPGILRLDYASTEERTQVVHIVTPLTEPRSTGTPDGAARLAIIVDDLGNDRAPAETLFAMAEPLTVSVLPHLAHSDDIAEDAHRRGDQVLLHIPMESSRGEKEESIELRPGMDPGAVSRTVSEMLDTVPEAVGVNNHQGSLSTADSSLMDALMTVLAQRGLFFVDSRTTAATVAYAAAVRAGVPAASRSVFLDDTETPEAVRAQLALAAQDARRSGAAIAIGHPHAVTLAVLSEELPKLSRTGVTLVYVSELCSSSSAPSVARVRKGFQQPSAPHAEQLPAPR